MFRYGVVTGGIAIAAMCTPVAPVVLIGSIIGGGVSAVYGTTRAVTRLVDKGQHGENMVDLESFTLYFSIAATPLHFTASILNANLARAAVANGRIFSSSTRMVASVLNFGTQGVDGVLVGCGLINLIEKHKKSQLQPLDFLQFSMSVFFFTNTLMKPQMVRKIIEQAQDGHIQNYMDSMTDESVKDTFQRFVYQNKGVGDITSKSKIVRTINRIENPDAVFGGLNNAADIKIGGRKGKTLLVTDSNNQINRINPNRIIFKETTQRPAGNYAPIYKKVQKCLDKNPNDVEINGNKIFKNMTGRQMARVSTVIQGTAKLDKNVVELAMDIAKQMNKGNIDDFLSIVEIVAADVEKRPTGVSKGDAVNTIRNNSDNFKRGLNKEIKVANDLASQSGLNFEDPLKAVYHYRKHGADFPGKLKHQSPIEVYLKDVPDRFIADANLVEIETFQDGTKRKFYMAPDDKFAVVIESTDNRKISTMYRKPGTYQSVSDRMSNINAEGQTPDFLFDLPNCIRKYTGYNGTAIFVTLAGGERVNLNDLQRVDVNVGP